MEQFMKPQCQFETTRYKHEKNYPGRIGKTLAKRRAQQEAQRQKQVEAKQRDARRLQTLIISLAHEVANLDESIVSEQALSRDREPSHFACPISVSMMRARRENLNNTIEGLTDRLSGLCQAVALSSNSAEVNASGDLQIATDFNFSQGYGPCSNF
jgi:hypothetical protein